MMRKLSIVFIFSLFFGCAPGITKTELSQLYERNFEGLVLPEVSKIKAEGLKRSFPYSTFDRTWDATLLVAMQYGVIVHASKQNGTAAIIANTPLVIYIEQGESVTAYIDCLCSLYKRVDTPESTPPNIKPDLKEKMANNFFDKLATQLYAEEKWKYLSLSPSYPVSSPISRPASNSSTNLSSKKSSIIDEGQISLNLKAGREFFEDGDYNKAIETFNRILEADPNNKEALDAIDKTKRAEKAEKEIGTRQ